MFHLISRAYGHISGIRWLYPKKFGGDNSWLYHAISCYITFINPNWWFTIHNASQMMGLITIIFMTMWVFLFFISNTNNLNPIKSYINMPLICNSIKSSYPHCTQVPSAHLSCPVFVSCASFKARKSRWHLHGWIGEYWWAQGMAQKLQSSTTCSRFHFSRCLMISVGLHFQDATSWNPGTCPATRAKWQLTEIKLSILSA